MTALKRFRALYGASPLHLLALVASFAIAGAAVVGWFQRPRDVLTVLEWFLAAILLHDLVLLPLYSLLDRVAFGGHGERGAQSQSKAVPGSVNATPYIRVPAILSGLLLVVFFPVIFGLGAQAELAASGIAERGYLARWLLATGAMFALSGGAYAVALARARVPEPAAAPGRDPTIAGDESPPPTDLDSDRTTPGSGSPGSAAVDPDQATPDYGSPAVGDPHPSQTAGDGSPAAGGPHPSQTAPGDGSPAAGGPHPSQTAPGDDVAPPQGPD